MYTTNCNVQASEEQTRLISPAFFAQDFVFWVYKVSYDQKSLDLLGIMGK